MSWRRRYVGSAIMARSTASLTKFGRSCRACPMAKNRESTVLLRCKHCKVTYQKVKSTMRWCAKCGRELKVVEKKEPKRG